MFKVILMTLFLIIYRRKYENNQDFGVYEENSLQKLANTHQVLLKYLFFKVENT